MVGNSYQINTNTLYSGLQAQQLNFSQFYTSEWNLNNINMFFSHPHKYKT